MTSKEKQKRKRKILLRQNLPLLIRGPIRREPGLTRRKPRRGGLRQTPLIINRKNENVQYTNLKYASTHTITYFQINLHHRKRATAGLCQQLAEGKEDLGLIQEPWLYVQRPNKRSNQCGGTVYSAAACNNTRSCIYIRSLINALPLLEFCSKGTYTYGRDCEDLVVASGYLPYDSDEPPPTKEMRDINYHHQ
jgi:hypothetical protein